MTEMQQIHKKLEDQGAKLDAIQKTLSQIAVQDEQIRQLQKEHHVLWQKFDEVCGPQGVLTTIQNHQASCPRTQMRYLWCVVIPMGLTQLATALKILGVI